MIEEIRSIFPQGSHQNSFSYPPQVHKRIFFFYITSSQLPSVACATSSEDQEEDDEGEEGVRRIPGSCLGRKTASAQRIIMHLCQRLCQSRKVLYIVFTLVFLWLSVKLELVLLKRVTKTRLFFHKGYVLDTPGCRLPDYDPFHWTVRAHYRNQSGGEDLCDESGYLVTFADRTTPVLNERVLASRYNATVADVTCFYAEILRNTSSPVPDNATVVGPWRTVEFGR
nr:uncharacterized protein LOC129382329 [Dermacentor andersoni]